MKTKTKTETKTNNAEFKQESWEMFSDTSPKSHHVEEDLELVCVVRKTKDQWVEVTGKADFGSNSELSSNYSCPKM